MDGLFLALMAAMVAAAVVIRRKARDPEDPFGRWFQSRVKPRLPGLAMAFSLATLLIWAAIFIAADPEDRRNLNKTFKGWFKSGAEVEQRDGPK